MQLAERYAQFIAETRYESLPPEVIGQARRCLMDFLGVALAGSRVGLAPLMAEVTCRAGGAGEASLIGEDRKVPVLDAALLNGARGHTLDMDDGHRYANAHPAVVVIPAALALAERGDATLGRLLEAVVSGYEVFIRIARAMNPGHLQRGFHSTGTVGPFGAAAACSRLACLGERETAHALSLAALQGSGLLQVTSSGEMAKPLHPARATQAGLLAALLAERGAEGPDGIFEGAKGYFHAFADGVDMGKATEGLGTTFEICGVYFKMHAACRHVHPTLDGLHQILVAENLAPEAIERVDVSTYSVAHSLTGAQKDHVTELGAKFSIPLSVALMAIHRKAGVDVYSEKCLRDPEVANLARRVSVSPDVARDLVYPTKRSAEVRLTTVSGDVFSREVEIPRGDPESPFTDEEMRGKFRGNAGKVLAEETVAELEGLITGDASVPVRRIADLLRKAAEQAG